MKNFVIVSSRPWNAELAIDLADRIPKYRFHHIRDTEKFTRENMDRLNPDKIFIPHWSHMIPEEIFSEYDCVLFHMTDLPYGRGGSPLQNLISKGAKETVMSAIRVTKELDAGPIYMKRELSLCGTAEEIFLRANDLIAEMISKLILESHEPEDQEGEVELFIRRRPEESDIAGLTTVNDLYDHIRMLDAEGYPSACLETENFRFEFTRASLKADKSILADVRIIQK